ncbi:hypothetical protein KAJ83_05785 [Marivibrio halodurans]|uniref:Uncharacterized protein n=1 Tax=Marivibrio halodurans TaxID=2039722 RepID=A0A8J7RY32_9PROT|nr:DUF6476 family protein [Marivibrio halodurans]MBP5856510.1 hypothetical protein [Marivibrio halodurans]
MQALKALVIGMGVLLILGVVGLVYAIVTDAGKKVAPLAGAGTPMRVELPAGSAVKGIHPDGDRLYLHLETGSGTRILILDSATGRDLGSIDLVPGGVE